MHEAIASPNTLQEMAGTGILQEGASTKRKVSSTPEPEPQEKVFSNWSQPEE
jgi:hypothetical protein